MSDQTRGKNHYWFPAKKYGWGWGLPSVWQGWVTLLIYLGLIGLSAYEFPPEEKAIQFIFFSIVFTVMLLAVCWIKGEPPRWRNG